jgi:hypothetical protein
VDFVFCLEKELVSKVSCCHSGEGRHPVLFWTPGLAGVTHLNRFEIGSKELDWLKQKIKKKEMEK